ERREEIEHARGQAFRFDFELEHFVRIDRDELGEWTTRFAELFDRHLFDRFECDELESVAGAPGLSFDEETGIEMKSLDQSARHERVALCRHVVVRGVHENAGAVRLHIKNSGDLGEITRRDVGGRNVRFRAALVALAAGASSTSRATSPPATAASIEVASASFAILRNCFVAGRWRTVVGAIDAGLRACRPALTAASAPAALTRCAIVWCHSTSKKQIVRERRVHL